MDTIVLTLMNVNCLMVDVVFLHMLNVLTLL